MGQPRAFCLNMDSRPDRWRQAQEEFARIGWTVTREPAVVHRVSPYCQLDAPHAGCLDSHKRLWQRCLDDQLGVIAVFEDDVIFPADFKDIFVAAMTELPPDWAFWQLHSFHAAQVPYSEHLVKIIGAGWGTHAYLVRESGCRALLSIADDTPVDVRVTAGLLSRNFTPYGTATRRALAFQRGADSDIPRTAQLAFWQRQRARHYR